MRWMNHNKTRVMDFFRRQDRDHDGKVTRQEFIQGILASSELRKHGGIYCSWMVLDNLVKGMDGYFEGAKRVFIKGIIASRELGR